MTNSAPIQPNPAASSAGRLRTDLWWAAGIFLATAIGALIFGLLAGVTWRSAAGSTAHVLGAIASGVLLGGALTGCLTIWWWTHRRRGELSLREFWGLVPPRHSLWHTLWEAPLAMVLQVVAMLAVSGVFHRAPEGSAGQKSHQYVGLPLPLLLVLGVCTVLVLPAIEEIVFRRLLLTVLSARMPLLAAWVLSSACFGLAHAIPVLMVPLAVSGLCFGAAFLWHRSLWACWILHAANNAVVFASTVALLS